MTSAAPADRPDRPLPGVVAARGWLHPRAGERVETRRALAVLRERGVLAAVQQEQPEVDDLCDVTLLVDEERRVLVVTSGGVVGGPHLHEYAPELVEALGAAIEIDGEFHDVDPVSTEVGAPGGGEGRDSGDMLPVGGEGDESEDFVEDFTGEFHDELFVLGDPDPGTPDVLLSHLVPSSLPQLAAVVGSGLVAGHVDGWTLARFDDHAVPVADHGWLPGDLPVVHLTRVREQRFVQVITSFSSLPTLLLTRHGDQDTTYGAHEVDRTLVDALVDSHLAPGSDVQALAESKYFGHVDARALAEALQQPLDEHWLTGVLGVLGLPTVAADVLEGRADVLVDLPGATRVEARSFLGSMGETLRRYYDAPPEEVARRTPYGRLYAAVVATPGRVAATVAAETALAAWLLARSRRYTGTRRSLLATVGMSAAADVAFHLALAPAKFRRH